jgi:hypothetical protein
MFIKTVNSFNEIQITKTRPLVICDIDDTLLYFKLNINRIINQSNTNSEKYIPHHTDFVGFNELTKRITQLKGKLIFLTARNKEHENYTKENFTSIGLNYNNYEVHYTNNTISKGEYIYNYIQTHEHDDIIFIDDRIDYINTVLDYTPYVDCYLFDNLKLIE